MTNRHFHAGELALQNKMGMRKQIDRATEVMMRDYMPEQHREFFADLEYLFLGTVGKESEPFASIVTGPVGFVSSPEPQILRISKSIDISDPAFAALEVGSPVGVLGLDFTNRRRNRMHGKIMRVGEHSFDIRVIQSYGNCPKYISTREIIERLDGDAESKQIKKRKLGTDAIALIAKADTFFIASHHLDGSGSPYEGADISHRGGNPGFVRVEKGNTLIVPDYQGNNLFNTLGNLIVNSIAGLLFIDFENGDLLRLIGYASIIEDSPEVSEYPGAKRLLKVDITNTYQHRAGCRLRWALPETSRFSPTI